MLVDRVPALLVIGALTAGCGSPWGGPSSAAGGRAMRAAAARPVNVVIVTLDTTRADRLSAYGFMDASMPATDRLAAEGVVFDQAVSVAPLTLPAHCSLFTGKLPPSHAVRDNADPALAEAHITLAERLQAEGYGTAAFVGATVLDADRGLAQGFDRYTGAGAASSADRRQRRGDEVMSDALTWLDAAPAAPFFLWTHLYDPHRPYDPPEPFRSMPDPYAAEIAFADAQIGRLIEALERRHLLDRTIVVVAADHGESLGEHGERDHGIFVYDGVLRVPLIIRAPGLSPRRVGAVVRLVDVMPTVLDLLGLSGPAGDGVSLAALMRGHAPDPGLEAYAESLYPQRFGWSALRSLRDGRFKLIDAPRPELYDLERDPFEQSNLHAARPVIARAMTRRLAEYDRAAHAGGTASGAPPSVAPDLSARLAALGYVGTGPAQRPAPGGGLPDPKDCIAGMEMPTSAAVRGAFDLCR